MSKFTNSEVVVAWEYGRTAENHRGSFSTDGKRLYSYALQIGDTCERTGKKILRDYTAHTGWGFKSQTTSCHVGLARRKADIISKGKR